MLSGIEIKEQIINQLKTLPVCKPSSNMRNWVVRCPYCGDSLNPKHAHFPSISSSFRTKWKEYQHYVHKKYIITIGKT